MRTKFYTAIWIICLTTLFSISTTTLYGFRFEESRKRSFTVNSKGSVQLNALRGNIEIRTHSENQVNVTAIVMSNRNEEIEKSIINFDLKDNSLIITENPKTVPAGVNIEYYIKVPEYLETLTLTTHTGEIKSRGRYSSIRFRTGTGEIDFRGNLRTGNLQSANGYIRANVRGKLKGDLSVRSSNGSIAVELDSDSHFTVEGKTFSGSIQSEFRTKESSDVAGVTIIGAINDGTHKVKLKTTNGNISLLKK